jgi:hypothetical protein
MILRADVFPAFSNPLSAEASRGPQENGQIGSDLPVPANLDCA